MIAAQVLFYTTITQQRDENIREKIYSANESALVEKLVTVEKEHFYHNISSLNAFI